MLSASFHLTFSYFFSQYLYLYTYKTTTITKKETKKKKSVLTFETFIFKFLVFLLNFVYNHSHTNFKIVLRI